MSSDCKHSKWEFLKILQYTGITYTIHIQYLVARTYNQFLLDALHS